MCLIQQEDILIINIYVPINRPLEYMKQKLTEKKNTQVYNNRLKLGLHYENGLKTKNIYIKRELEHNKLSRSNRHIYRTLTKTSKHTKTVTHFS